MTAWGNEKPHWTFSREERLELETSPMRPALKGLGCGDNSLPGRRSLCSLLPTGEDRVPTTLHQSARPVADSRNLWGDETLSMSPSHSETLKKSPSAITCRRWNEWKKNLTPAPASTTFVTPFVPVGYLSQQRAGSKRTHQFAYECSKSRASVARKTSSLLSTLVAAFIAPGGLCRILVPYSGIGTGNGLCGL
jgi:hypothetical protein